MRVVVALYAPAAMTADQLQLAVRYAVTHYVTLVNWHTEEYDTPKITKSNVFHSGALLPLYLDCP